MFVRRKSNASGSTSVQIDDKSSGRFRVVRSLGVGWSESDLVDLERAAYREMEGMRMQGSLGLCFAEDSAFLASLSSGLESVVPVGPEPVLVEKAIEIVKTIFEIQVTIPISKQPHKILFLKDPDQKHLLDILGINW